jgi:hypothetical protein
MTISLVYHSEFQGPKCPWNAKVSERQGYGQKYQLLINDSFAKFFVFVMTKMILSN